MTVCKHTWGTCPNRKGGAPHICLETVSPTVRHDHLCWHCPERS